MNDLNSLLDRAAGPTGAPVDARSDLTRGHRALARTRRRRGAAGLLGAAAVGALGAGLVRGGDGGGQGAPTRVADQPTVSPTPSVPTLPPSPTVSPTDPPTLPPATDGLRDLNGNPVTESPAPGAPVTGSADPTWFGVPPAPEGWVLQGNSPYGVTWARPGDTTVPEDFEGKVVLMFEANPPSGTPQDVDGRRVWVDRGTGGEYTTVAVRTRADEPRGLLVLQFPDPALDVEQAIALVTAVRVREGAVPVAG